MPLVGGTFSAQLVPQIAALLERHGFTRHDLDGFAVASGPGSFTGLRVGLVAVKGLAEVLGKPISTVSLLEAIAIESGLAGRVIAALDAGRGEAFVGDYEVASSGARLISERLVTLTQLAGSALFLTPSKSIAELARGKGLQVKEVTQPRSDAIARIGADKIFRGETVSVEELEANYIRRSDAEIFAKNL